MNTFDDFKRVLGSCDVIVYVKGLICEGGGIRRWWVHVGFGHDGRSETVVARAYDIGMMVGYIRCSEGLCISMLLREESHYEKMKK